jgi:hypothetical protein
VGKEVDDCVSDMEKNNQARPGMQSIVSLASFYLLGIVVFDKYVVRFLASLLILR